MFKSKPRGLDMSWLCKADGSALPLVAEADVEVLLPAPYRHHWASDFVYVCVFTISDDSLSGVIARPRHRRQGKGF